MFGDAWWLLVESLPALAKASDTSAQMDPFGTPPVVATGIRPPEQACMTSADKPLQLPSLCQQQEPHR